MPSVGGDLESTSESLIDGVRRFDESAWRRLLLIYGPLVYRWCRRAGLQQADAADVVQDVFGALVEGIGGFRFQEGKGGFRGWLHGITRHKLADHFRHRFPQPLEHSSLVQTLPAVPEQLSEEAQDQALIVHAVLAQIRPEYEPHNWEAFYRTAVLQQPAVQVAAELGLTSTAVRQAKFRILRRLRRELDGLQ